MKEIFEQSNSIKGQEDKINIKADAEALISNEIKAKGELTTAAYNDIIKYMAEAKIQVEEFNASVDKKTLVGEGTFIKTAIDAEKGETLKGATTVDTSDFSKSLTEKIKQMNDAVGDLQSVKDLSDMQEKLAPILNVDNFTGALPKASVYSDGELAAEVAPVTAPVKPELNEEEQIRAEAKNNTSTREGELQNMRKQ